MKRSLGILIVAAVVSTVAVSCARKAKVIPVRKMEKIYREMFLADQWVADNATRRRKADTTWFYEPIFEKYGYDVEDYRKSVDHYLSGEGRLRSPVRGRCHQPVDRQEGQDEGPGRFYRVRDEDLCP